jgi:hypothetical protein
MLLLILYLSHPPLNGPLGRLGYSKVFINVLIEGSGCVVTLPYNLYGGRFLASGGSSWKVMQNGALCLQLFHMLLSVQKP